MNMHAISPLRPLLLPANMTEDIAWINEAVCRFPDEKERQLGTAEVSLEKIGLEVPQLGFLCEERTTWRASRKTVCERAVVQLGHSIEDLRCEPNCVGGCIVGR